MGYPKTISVTMQKHNALLVVHICIRGWVRFNKPKKRAANNCFVCFFVIRS